MLVTSSGLLLSPRVSTSVFAFPSWQSNTVKATDVVYTLLHELQPHSMTDTPPWDPQRLSEIIAAHADLEGPLLPILHAVQDAFGFVPRDAIPEIARALNLTRAEVYGVVSFYHDFRERPVGRRHVRLCRAEACQSRGGREVAAAVLQHFNVGWGETSTDGAVTVDAVYCLGLCSVAPAALVDGEPHGHVDAPHLIQLAGRDA